MKFQNIDLSKTIMVLAFLLSLVTAWLQFRDKPVDLFLARSIFLENDEKISRRDDLTHLFGISDRYVFFSPIKWEVMISNRSDVKVYITKVSINNIEGASINYSGDMLKSFIEKNREKDNDVFPFEIDAHQAKSFIISIEMPLRYFENDSCVNEVTFPNIRSCYFRAGTDIYGNALIEEEMIEHLPGLRQTLIREDLSAAARYYIDVSLSDGQKFSFPLTIYDQ